MKSAKKLIAAAIIGILLASQLMPVHTLAAGKTKTVKVTTKSFEKEYKDEDGQVVFKASFQQPVLEGNTKAIKKINKTYSDLLKNYKATIKDNVKTAKEDKKARGDEEDSFIPYEDAVEMQVTYNKNGIICILLNGYEYWGGAHGMPYRVPHTFDLNTGKELTVKDILKGSDKTINKRIENAFLKLIKNNPDEYFKDAEKSIKNTEGKDLPFYLSKTAMVFYRYPYDIGPYASGYAEGKISYKTIAAFQLDLR